MPRTRSLAWSELKIGLMSVFAIIVATAFIFLLTGSNGFFWQRYSLKAVFPDIAGLKEGAPVRVAGVEVGSVTGVEFIGDRVEVLMEVLKENRPRITTTSVATLGSVSLLGEAALDITASGAGTPIPDWGYVPSRPAGGSLASVADSANAGLEEATALMKDIRAGKGTLGRLFTDEQLYNELTGLVSSAEQVTNSINQGRGTIGQLMKFTRRGDWPPSCGADTATRAAKAISRFRMMLTRCSGSSPGLPSRARCTECCTGDRRSRPTPAVSRPIHWRNTALARQARGTAA